jgi:hypothetical protein
VVHQPMMPTQTSTMKINGGKKRRRMAFKNESYIYLV